VADLETMLPMIFSEGVITGRLTPNQFVAVTSANQAQLFGLSQTKGDVAVGADADLVVWDPEAKWVVDGASMESGAGYSPYDGWEVQGRPLFTISRGDVILDPDGVLGSPGRGRLVPRGPIASLHDGGSRSSK
jgi:dihydropyrimidinase